MKVAVKNNWKKIFKKFYKEADSFFSTVDIRHIMLIAFALHLFASAFPNDGGMIFDEKHYVPASRLTLEGVGANPEHTPYTKILIAASIAVFGDHWFAWRFPIFVSSTLSLYAFYLLATKFLEKKYALYAAAFLAFDIVLFIHGTIAVLDFPCILFGILFMYFYFEKKYKLSALCAGISFLFLEKVLFFMAAVGFYHLIMYFRNRQSISNVNLSEKKRSGRSFKKIRFRKIINRNYAVKTVSFIMIFSIIVVSGIAIYDAVWLPPRKAIISIKNRVTIYKNQDGIAYSTTTARFTETSHEHINNPIEHARYAFNYFFVSPPNVVSSSTEWQEPWTWVLPIHPFRSAGYLVVTVRTGSIAIQKIKWLSQGTIPIWYSIWLILSMTVWNILKRKTTKFDILFLTWMGSAYLPWIIWGIRDIQRFPFNYMFIYAVPALCLGIPYFWSRLGIPENLKKIGLFIHLVTTIVFFLYFYPVGLIFK
jgi:hypothetical protein